MPRCDYCGRENEPVEQFCSGCGTELPAQVELENQADSTNAVPPPLPDVPHDVPTLNAWCAVKIFIIYLGAQFLVGLLFGLVMSSVSVLEGKRLENPQERLEFAKTLAAPAVALSFLFGGLAGIAAAFAFISGQLKDRTPTGAAWVFGSAKEASQAVILGVLAAFTNLFLSGVALRLGVPKSTRDLFSSMAATPGLSRILLVLSVLLLAPLFEELLFRGVIYAGLRRSLGSVKAAVYTTGVFTLLHIGEWSHFWPAALGVAGMASLALWLRLRSGAIGPAIGAHFGYNATLIIALLLYISHATPK